MRIEEALSQVRMLQMQVERAQHVCCYRSATIAASGVLALGAAISQSYWIRNPLDDLPRYLSLWISVAALSVGITGTEVLVRWLRTDSEHVRRQTVRTVRQFVPCMMVGALMTWAVSLFCPEHAALLPALWSVVFSLGIFASCVYLPTGGIAVAAYYLLAGLVCLRWGQGDEALRPWTMVVTFAVGQWITAFVLYRQREIADECT